MGATRQTSQLQLDLDPHYTLLVTHPQAKSHTQRIHDSSKTDHQRPKGGCCYCSVIELCLTLCNPVDNSMPGSFVPHYLPEFAQIYARSVGDDT